MDTRLGSAAPARQSPGARPPASRRRGITSLLAMLYLVIFASLAIGFYAQTNMSAQVSTNERRSGEALMAAECGLQFIRYELSRVTLDPLLTNDQVFEEMNMDLAGNLNGTANLENGATVGDIVYDPANLKPPYFNIPADPTKYIRAAENGPYFRVRVEQQGRDIVVTTVGKSASAVSSSAGARGILVRFQTKEWPNRVFSYGMASRNAVRVDVSKLIVQGTPDSQASILTTYTGGTPVTIGNLSSTILQPTGIEGNITVMSGSPAVSYVGSVSVGGQTTIAGINASQVKTITEAPEWPTPDTSVFEKYATTKWVAGQTVYDNIYIPAGSNPIFDSTMTVRGAVLVYPPNTVNFQGGVKIQAVIVGKAGGSIATNIIRFSGSGVAKDPLSSLPDEPKFAELRQMSGTFIVAPTWDVSLTGNFASVAGSIAAERITFSGNTSGSVTGSLVNLGNYPLTISGSSNLNLSAPTEDKRPGLRFTERFAPVRSSYKEIAPKD
jgi:hypothetical protein